MEQKPFEGLHIQVHIKLNTYHEQIVAVLEGIAAFFISTGFAVFAYVLTTDKPGCDRPRCRPPPLFVFEPISKTERRKGNEKL